MSSAKVFGHVAGLDRRHAHLLQRIGEFLQLRGVVELGPMRQPAGPGKDRGDRIGRSLLAALMLAEVAGDGAVSGFGLNRAPVRRHQHRRHQAERAKALRDRIGLDVAIVVLARPDIAAGPFQA